MTAKTLKSEKIVSLHILTLCLFLILLSACNTKVDNNNNLQHKSPAVNSENAYHNPLLDVGAEPWAIFHNGYYYYMHGSDNKVILWKSKDITKLADAPSKIVWIPNDPESASHLWAPELHRINDKWYIYFSADDGQMDNHQIYVIENESDDPFEGEFKMKGRIATDKANNWAIHANVFEHNNEWYMTWSGWQSVRIEAEVQCIYIAKMKNPWELASDRVPISKPEYEWERQWINPDGSKTAYPIYVNESPQYFHSKDKDKVLIYYSASGNWTPYHAIGLVAADANSDLLDTKSWTKSQEAIFRQANGVYGPGSLSFIPSPDGEETYFLYHARSVVNDPSGSRESRSPRLQKVEWHADGMPNLGIPTAIKTALQKPSGDIQ